MVKSSLDKKFDKIKEREEAKSFSKKTRSRIISKFINNRLAVLGLVIFSVILLATIFAPFLSPYDPMRVDLRSMRQPPSLITGLVQIILAEMFLLVFYLVVVFQYS